MISVELARALRDRGVVWQPVSGDRFVVTGRNMDAEVFTVSEMTVQVHGLQVIGFNGSDEWALDSVEYDQALWLPREAQLRELLGGTFRRLERSDASWTVTTEVLGEAHASTHADAEEAYGQALLHLLQLTR